jgi:hypothetical protein
MQTVDEWAEIRRLHFSEQLGIKAIAQRLGIARNTVRSAVRATAPPRYARAPQPSLLDAAEPAIRVLLKEFPAMPASVIAERIGWSNGMTILRARVAELRPLYAPPDPVQRTTTNPASSHSSTSGSQRPRSRLVSARTPTSGSSPRCAAFRGSWRGGWCKHEPPTTCSVA